MGNNIVLIGMPASGKSFICNKLAAILGNYTPIDTDVLIEKTMAITISEIFEKYSEDYFRKLEYDTIKMVCTGNNKIISIGGGAFENPDNRRTLLNFGTVFYLKSSLNTLYQRISDDKTRPLLNCSEPYKALEKLLNKREYNYNRAHHVINTDNLNEDEIINYILGKLNENNS